MKGRKRMALAEAIQVQQEKFPVDVCIYCGSETRIEPSPSLFNGMVVVDMPKHVCHKCNEQYESATIGVAVEELQEEFGLKGQVSINDLLKVEREAFSCGDSN